MKFAHLTSFLISLFIAPAAFAAGDAGLFVEPGVTYSQYDSSIDYPAPFSNSKGEVKGFGLMARLGFHISDVVFVAADARYSMPKFKDSTNNLDANAKQMDIGPVVGVQMPVVGLRVWGEYVAASQLDPDASNGFDYKFTDGKGYRIGAGFRVAIVSLNLEYQKIDYDKTTVQQLGGFATNTDTDMIHFNGEGWVASVSFPLEL
jgi:hypothetical protein